MKNWLRLPQSVVNDDLEVDSLIEEARTHCELLSNCALVRSTFVQYLDHFPGHHRDGHSGAGAGYGFGVAGEGWGNGRYNRHQRPANEIKIKRPPLVSVQPIVFIGTDGRPYTLNPGQDFIVDVASQPGRIRPMPNCSWPDTLDVPAAIAIPFTAGYAPNSWAPAQIAEPETVTEAIDPSWKPGVTLQQYSYFVDPNGNVEVQMNAGPVVTGATEPTWGAIGSTQTPGDGTSYLNVGPIRGFWTPGTLYTGQQQYVILDFNSNLQLLNVPSLTSQNIAPYSLQAVGASPLPWGTTRSTPTTDNGVANAWICLGAYTALGNTGLSVPNAPEQQAAYVVDWTLPLSATRAMKALVTHWYYNREPVAGETARKVPLHVEDMLGEITIYDFSPTP